MAIPSGGGSEVLKRNSISGQTTTWTELDWAGEQTTAGATSGTTVIPAYTIITIMSVSFSNGSGAARTINMKCTASGRNQVQFFGGEPVPINGTFIFNDRIVLYPGDKLMFYASGSSVDIWINYIKQDWT